MKDNVVMDLSRLPIHGTGIASPTWWATCAFMLIEGSGFALAMSVYFYLMSLGTPWPTDTSVPDLGPGTWLTGLLLASVIPNVLIARWAKHEKLWHVRIGLVTMTIFGIAPLVLRIFEFPALNVQWDANAYGSITWTLLGLHTTHILTDVIDTVVLAVLMFTRHANNRRRLGDVQDNALYWNFVVITWLPIYACIYWVPRL